MQERIQPHTLKDVLRESDFWIKNFKNTERIMDFSSAIFAFSLTLLIIQIDVPIDWTEDSLADEFRFIWPQVLGYLICFYVIIKYWISHLHLFSYIKLVNRNFLYLICLMLLSVTFLPFPSDLFSTHFDKITATIIFALSISLVSIMSFFIWLYLYSHKEMHHPGIDRKIFLYNAFSGLNITLAFIVSSIYIWQTKNDYLFWVIYLVTIIVLNFIRKQIAKRLA